MSHKFPKPEKKTLIAVYSELKSISKLSKHYGTSNPTVRSWLIAYNIPRYSHKETCIFDRELKIVEMPARTELEFLYKNTSLVDISRLYGISQNTLYDWFEKLLIKQDDPSIRVSIGRKESFNTRFPLSKEQIESDYDTYQCMGGLALHYKCSMTTIKKLFKLYDVEARFAKSSVGQNEIITFIKDMNIEVDVNNRKLISPFELDIVIPHKKIAIEYCGNYFHSETWGNKDPSYHKKKQILCQKIGYKLITIFESDWKTKNDIIKSILSHKLGKTTESIYARNTTFKELVYKDVKQFETNNHIQGTRPARQYFGLFCGDELVMTASVGKPRFNKKYANELIRMTTKKNVIVVGGVSKILKNMKLKDCLTYADNRFGDGASYAQAGFTKIGESAPNYFYFHKSDHDTLFSRNKFQKKKIPNVDVSKTEYQNMLDQGYDRIWDCGNSIYELI